MGLPWGSPSVGDDIEGPSFFPLVERMGDLGTEFFSPWLFPACWSGQSGQLRLGCWAWVLRLSVGLCLGYTGHPVELGARTEIGSRLCQKGHHLSCLSILILIFNTSTGTYASPY